ncbi:acetylglucosamine-1-phosphate uridylyltransferase [Nocardioides sp. Root1257]|uniref:acyltransferase n=1 Tax=unclassified Nocardioides TaxID=2615069 RepID=UPI0007008AFD|nr:MULTISPECIES: acyltransferase [unclassified Nocardioides]KQW48824.1 acetylglucosamine-1-phosphate uridylyltransferase [Nocardioides sp. Root1257]KRC47999.1 acetylglucosamine-1-phosphate uridylyltransferase [Nocardioides sp. Root224]
MTRPPAATVHGSADVDPDASIGAGTVIWHLAQVRERAVVGKSCIVGRGAYVGPGVAIGDRCKIQNHALVYEPAFVESGAFIGPAVVLTNDMFPRAVTADGRLKSADDWQPVGVHVREGASIGARAVCVAPVSIGRWAMVAAGAVVTKDVPDFALVAGVPARQVRWVGHQGVPLENIGRNVYRCPVSGRQYVEWQGRLEEQVDVPPPRSPSIDDDQPVEHR